MQIFFILFLFCLNADTKRLFDSQHDLNDLSVQMQQAEEAAGTLITKCLKTRLSNLQDLF